MSDNWSQWAKFVLDTCASHCKAVSLVDTNFTSVWNPNYGLVIDADQLKSLSQAFVKDAFPSGIRVNNVKFMFVKKVEDDVSMYIQMGGDEESRDKILVVKGKSYAIVNQLPPKGNTTTVIDTCRDVFTKLVI
ncbi:hypothetical protein A3Q56_02852 [Intoshia linei]|uniref:Profilin n=1 Tax=Intoshia linei TaxID=1819745 RepID=A0A177B741_9BILA|nr:hypothetical protein A3Q56_02852 [Intoshia linei]